MGDGGVMRQMHCRPGGRRIRPIADDDADFRAAATGLHEQMQVQPKVDRADDGAGDAAVGQGEIRRLP